MRDEKQLTMIKSIVKCVARLIDHGQPSTTRNCGRIRGHSKGRWVEQRCVR